jgi:prepilin-type N-terminal cleavage/methylation domain-containing protein
MLLISPDMRITRRRHAAFTLIEVLVSVAILSIGIVVVLQALQQSVVFLGEARDCVWAHRIASEKIEETRLSALLANGPLSPCLAGGRYRVYFGEFQWESRISAGALEGLTVGAEIPETRTVTVTAWRDGGGRKYSCSSYIRSARQDKTEGAK